MRIKYSGNKKKSTTVKKKKSIIVAEDFTMHFVLLIDTNRTKDENKK